MSKNLDKWLNEFVENGADPSDVTNWPENAGGGGGGEQPGEAVVVVSELPDTGEIGKFYKVETNDVYAFTQYDRSSTYDFLDAYLYAAETIDVANQIITGFPDNGDALYIWIIEQNKMYSVTEEERAVEVPISSVSGVPCYILYRNEVACPTVLLKDFNFHVTGDVKDGTGHLLDGTAYSHVDGVYEVVLEKITGPVLVSNGIAYSTMEYQGVWNASMSVPAVMTYEEDGFTDDGYVAFPRWFYKNRYEDAYYVVQVAAEGTGASSMIWYEWDAEQRKYTYQVHTSSGPEYRVYYDSLQHEDYTAAVTNIAIYDSQELILWPNAGYYLWDEVKSDWVKYDSLPTRDFVYSGYTRNDGYWPVYNYKTFHATDPNLLPGNIRQGVEILGVEGTYRAPSQVANIILTIDDGSTLRTVFIPNDRYNAQMTLSIRTNSSNNEILYDFEGSLPLYGIPDFILGVIENRNADIVYNLGGYGIVTPVYNQGSCDPQLEPTGNTMTLYGIHYPMMDYFDPDSGDEMMLEELWLTFSPITINLQEV